ncbi:MAG: restriction endonuclease subunit S [Verrucomicrobia bacterium]|nr:restriction endonuclease subunit S [Verrucomicrobiota bacterium]MCH8513649.1 restriction endonuclease subunit S [Kiritimatiellia bacterium]
MTNSSQTLLSVRNNPDWASLPLFDRKGWKRVRFGDFAQSIGERVEPKDAQEAIYVGLEHLDPQCLHIRRWGKGSDVTGTKLRFRKGDIIFGRRRAYQRKLAVAEFDGICSAHAMVVRARPDMVLSEFLPFLMMSDRFMNRAVEISVGSLSPTINWKTLKLEEFDLPPLDQQRRIAEILWAVDEVEQTHRISAEEVVLSERAYYTKYFGKLFNEKKVVRLGDLSEFITSGSRGWAEHYSAVGPLFIRSQNIRDQLLDFADLQRVRPPDGAEGERTRTQAGDIVITITGNSVGNVAYIPNSLEEAYVSQHVGLVRLNEPDRHRMISSFFGKNGPGNDQILKAQYGLKPGLNLTALKNFLVPCPTENDLQEINECILNYDALRSDSQSHHQATMGLKCSINNTFLSAS